MIILLYMPQIDSVTTSWMGCRFRHQSGKTPEGPERDLDIIRLTVLDYAR
jgi:hypothetical protein